MFTEWLFDLVELAVIALTTVVLVIVVALTTGAI